MLLWDFVTDLNFLMHAKFPSFKVFFFSVEIVDFRLTDRL